MPKAHIGAIFAQYLYETKAVHEHELIQNLIIPIEVDDEDNASITVGIAEDIPVPEGARAN